MAVWNPGETMFTEFMGWRALAVKRQAAGPLGVQDLGRWDGARAEEAGSRVRVQQGGGGWEKALGFPPHSPTDTSPFCATPLSPPPALFLIQELFPLFYLSILGTRVYLHSRISVRIHLSALTSQRLKFLTMPQFSCITRY